MKNTLKYLTHMQPRAKALLIAQRYHLMSNSLNDWCNLLIFDNIAIQNNVVAADFKFKDLSRINARLSEYAQYTGGEM